MKYMFSISMLMLTAVASRASRHDNSKCRPVTVSYSECVNKTMTVTKNPPEGVDGCTNTTEVVSCVTSFTRPDENCTQIITTDLTACGTPGGDVNTLMKTITVIYTDCPKDLNVTQIPCNESGKMGDGHREGMHGDNIRGSWFREGDNHERHENETCKPYTLSYSECVDENLNIMNITKTPPIGVEGCTNVTEEIPCVSTQTSTWGGCTQNKTINNIACGTPGVDLNLLVKTITFSYSGCFSLEPKTIQIPCNRFGGIEGFRRQPAGNGTSGMQEGNNNKENGQENGEPGHSGSGGNVGFTTPPAGNGTSQMTEGNNKKENGSGQTNGGTVGFTTTPAGNGTSQMTEGNNKKENGSGQTKSEPGHSGSGGNVGSTTPPAGNGTSQMTEGNNKKENGSGQTNGGTVGFTTTPAGNGTSQMTEGNNKKENGSGQTNSEPGHSGSRGNDGSTTQPAGNGTSRMTEGNNKKEKGSGHTDSTTGHSGSEDNLDSTLQPIVSGTTGVRGVENGKGNGSFENKKSHNRVFVKTIPFILHSPGL